MMWIAIFTFFLLAGYFIYGRVLEKNWQIDIYRDQSDWQEDESVISRFGSHYVQLAQFALFLSFEMLISVVFGYVYGLIYACWLIIGTTFFSGALSYYGGMYALRHRGYTLNYAIKEKFGDFAHICTTLLFLGLIAVLLSDSYKSFSLVYENIFNLPPYLLLIYCSVVAIFFCFCSARQMTLIFSGIGIFAIITLGYMFFGSKLQLSNVEYGAQNFVINELKYAYPLAFFVITLGSVNCLQGLQAALIAPMIKNEKVGRRVFFGAAIFQGFFLIVANALVAAWNPDIQDFYASIFENETQYIVLQNVAIGVGGKKVTLILFALAIALFLGFVGSMARLARNLISETYLGKINFLAGIITILAVILPVFWLKRFNMRFEYVLIFTQLAGLLSCAMLIKVLKDENKKYYHILWPTTLVFGALIAYVMLVLFNCRLLSCYICGAAPLVASFIFYVLAKNKDALRAKWQQYQENKAIQRKIRQEKAEKLRLQKEQEKKLKKEEAERQKLEREELKKQKLEQKRLEKEQKNQEKEKKKTASLSLMIAQDQTEGKDNKELQLEKEIIRLQEERDKLELLVKEKQKELEKEQSKRLLLETSESVIEKVQEDEQDFMHEMEKLDEAILNVESLDIDNLIDEKNNQPEKTHPENKIHFDFDDDFKTDFEFEDSKESIQAEDVNTNPDAQTKKKHKRNHKNKNAENKSSD